MQCPSAEAQTMIATCTTVCDLLVKAGLLEESQVGPVMLECSKLQITSGEYLSEMGVEPQILRASILLLVLLRDRLVETETAVNALRMMAAAKLSLEDALTHVGWKRQYYEHIRLVSKLLLHSGCINKDQRNTAYDICFQNRLPMTQALVQRGIITNELAHTTLAVERLVTHEDLSLDVGIKVVREANSKNLSLAAALDAICTDVRHFKGTIFLGEILVAAECISAADLVASVERGFYEKRVLGKVLLSNGLLEEELLDLALRIQGQINEKFIDVQSGVQELKVACQRLRGRGKPQQFWVKDERVNN